MEQLNTSTGGAAFKAAESERWSSDPMNLLVNASVGMWFADIKQCRQSSSSCIAFLFFSLMDGTIWLIGRYQTGPIYNRGRR